MSRENFLHICCYRSEMSSKDSMLMIWLPGGWEKAFTSLGTCLWRGRRNPHVFLAFPLFPHFAWCMLLMLSYLPIMLIFPVTVKPSDGGPQTLKLRAKISLLNRLSPQAFRHHNRKLTNTWLIFFWGRLEQPCLLSFKHFRPHCDNCCFVGAGYFCST